MESDREMVNAVLQGDRHAFGILVKQTEGLVAQITFKMVGSPGDRKDIAQDIYLKAYKSIGRFKFKSKLSTWIGQIAYNTCLRYLEKKRLILLDNDGKNDDDDEHQLPDESDNAEVLLSNKDLKGVLNKELDQLQPLYKTLISLYHQEELTYAEIAEITELPEGTVKNYIFRARKQLRENILKTYKRDEL